MEVDGTFIDYKSPTSTFINRQKIARDFIRHRMELSVNEKLQFFSEITNYTCCTCTILLNIFYRVTIFLKLSLMIYLMRENFHNMITYDKALIRHYFGVILPLLYP